MSEGLTCPHGVPLHLAATFCLRCQGYNSRNLAEHNEVTAEIIAKRAMDRAKGVGSAWTLRYHHDQWAVFNVADNLAIEHYYTFARALSRVRELNAKEKQL